MGKIAGNNLPDALIKRVAVEPNRRAMLRRSLGRWVSTSWSEVERQVFQAAECLKQQGLQSGDRVAILSQNRPDAAILDWAILSLGAISVPIYPSVTADDIHFILHDCSARFIFIENSVQWEKLSTLQTRLETLEKIFSFQELNAPEVFFWKALVQDFWKERNPEEGYGFWKESAERLDADLPATLVYTSGTEGQPKGVVLSHGNFLAVLEDISKVIRVDEKDVTLLVLPVAHIMGRIEQMLSIGMGVVNAYGNLSRLSDDLLEVQPTIFFGVPRMFEKFRHSVLFAPQLRRHPLKARFAAWALAEGQRISSQKVMPDQKKNAWRNLRYSLLDHWVFSKIRMKFGGRLRFAVSGGAPLSEETATFFEACGILILEGYGLTESTGPLTLNTPQAYQFGTVGRPLPHAQVRFSDEGEILVKGPALYQGYYGQEEETRRSWTQDGWFHTGDIGQLNERGFLCITDRKKDIIVMSNGKNIAPLKIEHRFKKYPLISYVLVAGDNRQHLSALLTIHVNQARIFCERHKIIFRNVGELIQNPLFLNRVREIVKEVNAGLAPFEQIRKYRVLPRDFTIEAGELTPSLKVKRVFCTRKYQEAIEEMYT